MDRARTGVEWVKMSRHCWTEKKAEHQDGSAAEEEAGSAGHYARDSPERPASARKI